MSVAENPGQSRYDVTLEGEVVGFVAYRDDDGVRTLVHTEVDDGHEGQGIGGELIRGALDDIRATGLRVRPSCSFAAAYIEEHAEYRDLLVD